MAETTKKMGLATIMDSGNDKYRQRVLVATPTLGQIRIEWASAKYGSIIPTNFSKTDLLQFMNSFVAMRYLVAEAQNLAVVECLSKGFEWLLFHEDDVLLPVDAYVRFTDYMDKGDIPVVSGLYFTKSVPSEPMIYRNRGNHYFRGWKLEDKVWADGVPTGLLLVHASLLKAVYDDSPDYIIPHTGQRARRVFNTPSQSYFNEETGAQEALVGTSDLDFCTRVIKGNYLAKAGFPEIAKKRYPFLVDTAIFAKQIDPAGVQYPIQFPEEFLPEKDGEGEFKYKPQEIDG